MCRVITFMYSFLPKLAFSIVFFFIMKIFHSSSLIRDDSYFPEKIDHLADAYVYSLVIDNGILNNIFCDTLLAYLPKILHTYLQYSFMFWFRMIDNTCCDLIKYYLVKSLKSFASLFIIFWAQLRWHLFWINLYIFWVLSTNLVPILRVRWLLMML
jgi:hypothetical protein